MVTKFLEYIRKSKTGRLHLHDFCNIRANRCEPFTPHLELHVCILSGVSAHAQRRKEEAVEKLAEYVNILERNLSPDHQELVEAQQLLLIASRTRALRHAG